MSDRGIERAQTGGGGDTTDVNVIEWGGVTVAPAAAKADGQLNTAVVPEFGSRVQVFNGTTWDRARSGVVAAGATFVGYQDVLPIGRYNVTPPTLTDGQGVVFQLDVNGQLKVTFGGVSGVSTATSSFVGYQDILPVGKYNLTPPTLADGQGIILQLDVNGQLKVTTGAVYAVSTATSSYVGYQDILPVGRYNVTPPTLTDGQGVVLQLDVNGQLKVATSPAATTTAAVTSVAANLASVTLLSANANRRGATIYNDATTGIVLVKLGTTASATSFTVRLIVNAYYEVPFGYTGRIDAIWTIAEGSARITELTP